jgi:hypothetical protein
VPACATVAGFTASGYQRDKLQFACVSGNVSGNCLEAIMSSSRKSPVASYRHRMKRQGFVRVEVQVRKEDAGLIRRVAGALTDPDRAAQARILLHREFGEASTQGLKALLASAPEGIDVDRPYDTGRDTEF